MDGRTYQSPHRGRCYTSKKMETKHEIEKSYQISKPRPRKCPCIRNVGLVSAIQYLYYMLMSIQKQPIMTRRLPTSLQQCKVATFILVFYYTRKSTAFLVHAGSKEGMVQNMWYGSKNVQTNRQPPSGLLKIMYHQKVTTYPESNLWTDSIHFRCLGQISENFLQKLKFTRKYRVIFFTGTP